MNIKNIDFFFSENPNPMWIYDPSDLSIKQANVSACKLYGYSEEEMRSLTIMDLRPEGEHEKLKAYLSKPVKEFNNAGIWKHRKKNGDTIFVRVFSTPITYRDNNYKMVTVQDVTNEIQYQKELDMLFENSLDGIMLTSPDGRIFRANKAACDLLGMQEEEIKRLGREGLVYKDKKLQQALERRTKTGKFSGELTFLHKSGRKIPVDLTTSVYINLQGEQRTSLIFRDITGRKETEQKLQDILEYSTNMFYRHDTDHVLTYVSPQSKEFLGYSPEEAKLRWTEFATDHPVNQEGFEHSQKAIQTGQAQPAYPLQLRKADGDIIWVRVNEAPVVEHGKTVAIVGSLTDITEERRYEEALQESLERYHYATKATNDAIYDWNIEDDQLYLGEGFSRIFGYDTGVNIYSLEEYTKFVHPEDHPKAQQDLDETLQNSSRNHWEHEYRLKRSDGGYAHVIENGYIIRNKEGLAVRMIGAVRDVTERRKLKELLEDAQQLARIGAWEVDLVNDDLYWSPITKQIHEVPPDFIPDLETGVNFYKEGESRETIRKAVNEAIEHGTPWDVELQIVTGKGNERWVRAIGKAEVTDGTCTRLYGSFQDIHDRKEAQVNMQKADEERRQILERINDAFFAVDRNWTVIYWNKQAENILGVTQEEIIGENIWEKFPEAKDLAFFQKYREAFEKQVSIDFVEYFPPLEQWFDVSAHPSKEGLSVFFRDITAQKKAELELKKSFKEKETILESIEDGFFTVNKDWIVTYWNSAAERMLETPRDTILGKNLWDVFDDATDLPSYENYHRVMEQGVSVNFEDYYPPLQRWYNVSAYPSPDGITVYVQEITEHKEKEASLRESLKEKETLLAEIHHRVKNNMAVVSSLMQLQAFKEDDDNLSQRINDSVGRIQTMASIHEMLYQSESFSHLTIDEYLQKLVTNIVETFQIGKNVDVKFDLQEISLNINQAIPFSLIINEVITNAFKHAFDPDQTGAKLSVTLREEKDVMHTQIIDNGKGLPLDVSKTKESLGMQLIDTLSLQLGAKYRYYSENEKTYFTMEFEKKDV
ncbi:MAG: PAS domain S-box protein, partial [Balneolaceae bacterium]|nr:PAS domain S-box protein [Balneolaceae bacterium]